MQRFYFLLLIILAGEAGYAQLPRLVLPIGHSDYVYQAEFSPDGKRIVTASSDGTARIWDNYTGKLLLELIGHKKKIFNAFFNHDATAIATISADSSSIIWNGNNGEILFTIRSEKDINPLIKFSPDGKKFLIANINDSIILTEIKTGNRIYTLSGNTSIITDLEFSPDGKKIIAGYSDRVIRIRDFASGKMLVEIPEQPEGTRAMQCSPDGKKLVTVNGDFKSRLWDMATGAKIFEFPSDSGDIESVKFSKDGKQIIMLTEHAHLRRWSTETGKLLAEYKNDLPISWSRLSEGGNKLFVSHGNYLSGDVDIYEAITGRKLFTLTGHDKSVYSLVFSPDGSRILTASKDRTAKVWDVRNGKMFFDLKGHCSGAKFGLYSPDGKTILTPSFDFFARLWNTDNGHLQNRQKKIIVVSDYEEVNFAFFNHDGKNVSIPYREGLVLIGNIETGKVSSVLRGHSTFVNAARFSNDGKRIVTASLDNTAKIWDAVTSKELLTLKGHSDIVPYAEFSPDGAKVVTASMDQTVKVWDAATGAQLINIQGEAISMHARFSSNGKKIITDGGNYSAQIWDADSGKLFSELRGHTNDVTDVDFSPDGAKAVTASFDMSAKIWDVNSANVLYHLKGHTGPVLSSRFNPEGTRVLTVSSDKSNKIWNVSTGELLYTFFSLDTIDYLVQIPAGYYSGTPNGVKYLHYVDKDLKIISFDQLDVKYNRPDKVLEAIGNTDTALIKSYRKAWEKRIKKLRIDTTSFREGYSVPEADFVNRNDIAFEQNKEVLKLHITGNDNTYKLDRFNVWVNESPLFGQRGISVRKNNSSRIDTVITVKLSQGENSIETSITNVNGTESYRRPMQVNYTPPVRQKEITRFIGIGIDKFRQNQYNLQYSSKDITDMAVKLREKYGKDIIIDTLLNQNVTVDNIRSLKKKLLQTKENDKVIIAYSGHGILSKEYDYYLSTYSVNFNQPEVNGLPYDELENLLDSIPARRKLMLIDACHSGEVDKEDMVTLNEITDPYVKGLKPVRNKQPGQLGLRNSFELMQNLFVNVGKSTGATIISAAAGTQFALERNDLKNGVFTYAILEAMNQHTSLKVSELRRIVGERVVQLTNGLQKPTSRGETINIDWNIW